MFSYRDQVDKNRSNAEKLNKKEPSTTTKKSQQAQDKINQMQRRKEENELKKKFKVFSIFVLLETLRTQTLTFRSQRTSFNLLTIFTF